MKKFVWVGLLSLVCLLVLTGFGFKKDSPEERRKEIDEATAEVLADLYREVPGSKKYLDRAAGYAVFSKARRTTRAAARMCT